MGLATVISDPPVVEPISSPCGLHDLGKRSACMGLGLVPLPLQQPRECHRGTPPHVWMVYCPNVDENDGLNWPLFAAAGVAHDSGGLGGD